VPTATIDGILTRYEVSGAGPPLLMLSPGGFNAQLGNWQTLGIYRRLQLIPALSQRFTCVTFDRRESGGSGGRVERLGWDGYAAQASGLLAHLGVDRAHLLGGCAGCSVAAAFAVAYPGAVASMVLFSPAGGAKYRLKQHARFAAHLAYVDEHGLEAVATLAEGGQATFADDARVGPWGSTIRADRYFAGAYRRMDAARYSGLVAGTARGLFDRDTVPGAEPEDLLQLDVPALIVPGHDESHATSAARYLEECLPASDYWDVPVPEQTAANVPARIIGFFEGVTSGDRRPGAASPAPGGTRQPAAAWPPRHTAQTAPPGRLRVSIACGEYDRTQALLDGRVGVNGADPVVLGISDAFSRHQRMLVNREFDVAEVSLASYLMARERGEPLVAVPAFPYRMFRHQFILVRTDRGVDSPEDLAGRRVGTAMYQTTTMLWVRGMLEDLYGVPPTSIEWYTDRRELLALDPPGVKINRAPAGCRVEDMFRAGDLDALVLIEEVPPDLLSAPGVRRLFPAFASVEASYFGETSIFPIMHTVVIREELYRDQRWLARSTYDAFCESLRHSLHHERFPRVLNLAWAAAYFQHEAGVFGGSPYVYGIEANRPSLEAAVRYSERQGLTSRRLDLEELFVPELLGT
jgi:pimeloyl-ACP methyl ester carboxylesterase